MYINRMNHEAQLDQVQWNFIFLRETVCIPPPFDISITNQFMRDAASVNSS